MFVKPIAKAVILGVSLSLPFIASANEELAKKSNCLACHTVDKKILGPAYKDVAAKYENNPENVTMLVEKVKKGGSGNWGQNPMISDEDAKTLVEWVLSQ
ncbi:cytochrome C biogenesis protein CcsA [Gammaproteobacteria bacterium]|nr:cytochrome C biogenesis protein CcsA [Gammaproteobacteria bacterium]